MDVLIAGGAKSLVYGNFARKLAKHDIKVGWYVSRQDGASFKGIPSGCEGVIIIRDLISHSLFHKIYLGAKDANVPFAAVPRKWSQAFPVLKLQNFIATAPPIKNPPTAVSSSDDAVFQCALKAEQENRTPSLGEVYSYVRSVTGSIEGVTQSAIQMALSKVRALLPSDSTSSLDTLEVSDDMPTPDYMTLMEKLAIENPEILNNPDLLTKKLTRDTVMSPVAVRVMTPKLTAQFLQLLRKNPNVRDRVMRPYYIRWFKTLSLDMKPKEWASLTTMSSQGKKVFKVSPLHETLANARAEVFGEWARKLDRRTESHQYLRSVRPDLSLDQLLKEGKVKGFPAGRRKLTSPVAVREYLETLAMEQSPPAVIPSIPTTPAEPVVVKVTPTVEPVVVKVVPTTSADDMIAMASMIVDQVRELVLPLKAQLVKMQADLDRISWDLERLNNQPTPTVPTTSNDLNGFTVTVSMNPKQGS